MKNIYTLNDKQAFIGTVELLNNGVYWVELASGKALSLTRLGFFEWLERNNYYAF